MPGWEGEGTRRRRARHKSRMPPMVAALAILPASQPSRTHGKDQGWGRPQLNNSGCPPRPRCSKMRGPPEKNSNTNVSSQKSALRAKKLPSRSPFRPSAATCDRIVRFFCRYGSLSSHVLTKGGARPTEGQAPRREARLRAGGTPFCSRKRGARFLGKIK